MSTAGTGTATMFFQPQRLDQRQSNHAIGAMELDVKNTSQVFGILILVQINLAWASIQHQDGDDDEENALLALYFVSHPTKPLLYWT